MKRWKHYILKTIVGIVIGFAVIIVAASVMLKSDAFRHYLVEQATLLLSEKLNTHVAIKEADISLIPAHISLTGIDIEDRNRRKMLQIDRLLVKNRLWPLLFNEVRVNDAQISGLNAHLFKPSTHEPANYQFVIDAFRKDQPQKKKRKLVLNLKKLLVEDNSITYNDNHFSLKRLQYQKGGKGWLENLNTTVIEDTPKGKRTHQLRIDRVGFSENISTDRLLIINGLHYTTDKIKAEASLEMHFHHLDIDSLNASITNLQATEENSGYKMTGMKLTAQANKHEADIQDFTMSIVGKRNFKANLSLKDAHLTKDKNIDGHRLKAQWTMMEKNREAYHDATAEHVRLTPHEEGLMLDLQDIAYDHKDHKPRKNKTGIPDLGHLHVEGDLQMALTQPKRGTTQATLTRCELEERFSKMHITDMQLTLTHNKQTTLLDGLSMTVENPLMKLNGTLQIDKAQYQKNRLSTIENLRSQWHVPNAKGYQSRHQAEIEKVTVKEQDRLFRLDLTGLHYTSVSQQPGKVKTSKRGYPDLRHLDMTAHLHALLDKNSQEDIALTVTNGQAFDRVSGMKVQDLRLKANINKERTHVTQASTNWSTLNAKGKTDNHFSIADLHIKNLSSQRQVSVKGFHFASNDHQPRKPLKGKTPAPDAGHLNITGNLQMLLNHYHKDSVDLVVTRLDAQDKESGVTIGNLQTGIRSGTKKVTFNGIKGHFTWGDLEADIQSNLKADKNFQDIETDRLKVRVFNHETDDYTDCSIDRLTLGKNLTGSASNLLLKWKTHTKKGKVDKLIAINSLNMKQKDSRKQLTINGLRYATDNHKPRKNTGKPKHGFFDINHLDLHSDMTFNIKEIGNDGVKATLTRCSITDKTAGIHVVDLLLDADIQKDMAKLRNIRLRLTNSELKSHEAHFWFADKRRGTPFHFETDKVVGEVLLQDISHTFAPILKDFTLPLEVSTRVSGTDDDMAFENVTVNTLDNQLKIWATGRIVDMKDKYSMIVRFDIDSMYALGNSKMKIINLFPVKKLMMDQVEALGDIGYKGHFRVRWKKEEFHGRLTSAVGPIDFDFNLDEKNKFITGNFITDSLKFGKAFDVKSLKYMACKGDFLVDYAKARTAAMRTMRNGKLPIGQAKVDVIDAHYRIFHFKNLHAHLSSDGAVAKGRFELNSKYIDGIGKFAFMRTATEKKLRFRPGIRFHKRQKTYEIQRQQLKKQIQDIHTPISYVYLNRYEIPNLFY